MLRLDHLVGIAPSLAEGVEHVRVCLDLDIPYGGTHPEMGTHNHVLALGDGLYLEVIAVDPTASAPVGPRWFGLDDVEEVRSLWSTGRRLRAWVARTDDLDGVLAHHGALLGSKIALAGAGKHAYFSLPRDGSLPAGGVLPSVIERAGGAPRTRGLPDYGVRLREFVIEHPSPANVTALYEDLSVSDPPSVREAAEFRYIATIDTAGGLRKLH